MRESLQAPSRKARARDGATSRSASASEFATSLAKHAVEAVTDVDSSKTRRLRALSLFFNRSIARLVRVFALPRQARGSFVVVLVAGISKE